MRLRSWAACKDSAVVRRRVPLLAMVGLSALVAAGALLGPWGLGAAQLVVVVVLASGWPTLLGLPTQRGSTSVLAGCGAVATLIVLFAPTERPLQYVAAWLALSVIITFFHQLLRRDYRPRLVESVTGVVAGVVTANLAVGWLAAESTALVLLGACCLPVAALALAAPLPRRFTNPLAVAGSLVVAALLSALGPVGTLPAGVIGLLVGVVAVGLDRVFAHLPTMGSRQAGLAAGAATVASIGMVVYIASAALARFSGLFQ